MLHRFSLLSIAALLTLAACGDSAPPANDAAANNTAAIAAEPILGGTLEKTQNELIPPAPGEPGGLPDDKTPLSEAPFAPDSPQAAADLVQRYAAFLEERKFDEAYAIWGGGGDASGMTAADFARSFDKYSEIHAQVGGPSAAEGAAGSVYVTVPLQLYGRLKAGGTFNLIGPVTIRRVNDVPGATPAQLKWHIDNSDLKPKGVTREAGG